MSFRGRRRGGRWFVVFAWGKLQRDHAVDVPRDNILHN